jgi:hypothetical protein
MKPENSASLKVIAFGFFLLFLIFLGLSVPFYLRQREVLKNWIVTDARVSDSDVVSLPEKRGSAYDAHIVVVYRIGDSVLTSMVNSGYRSRRRSHAQAWVDRYPAGSQVRIAYNPLDTSQIRLDPGYNRYFFAVPLLIAEVGAGFALVAFIFFAIARYADRRNRLPQGRG